MTNSILTKAQAIREKIQTTAERSYTVSAYRYDSGQQGISLFVPGSKRPIPLDTALQLIGDSEAAMKAIESFMDGWDGKYPLVQGK